ncbi:ADP-ribosylglycohydrolase family protein [Spiractinospora alimapuensis]|uniref:ADP-ribosylglycohydrolase family protein n=1 Tax=Spiractinospora alimapuensis TaxID=2820884 RepID=UPI001F1C495A|nr:ADP-ribosylglycohydrolase family protein [Spiractinospora alimapuensis]QVQ52767.1 ADP-ribosylglycohydrolase family protein [Spiractinospora alimapuensis]
MTRDYRDRVRGCVLGGAVGDALGAPVEFSSLPGIRAEHGRAGVREFVVEYVDGRPHRGRVTDDTQMTLFTMEGLIRADIARGAHGPFDAVDALHDSYQSWLATQNRATPAGEGPGWLVGEQWLYDRRAPGNTCLTALMDAARTPGNRGVQARNKSKGCGGVMRSAPFGLLPPHAGWDGAEVFSMAAHAAGLTHGHVTGKLASAALALLVHRLLAGDGLHPALDTVHTRLAQYPGHEETSDALAEAREAAAREPVEPETVERLGGGWIAEQALAIAVYCALVHPGPHEMLDALALAVTHTGDSDSTGAVCGNILGALHGEAAVPAELAAAVEGRDTALLLADDFVWRFNRPADAQAPDGWDRRYRNA